MKSQEQRVTEVDAEGHALRACEREPLDVFEADGLTLTARAREFYEQTVVEEFRGNGSVSEAEARRVLARAYALFARKALDSGDANHARQCLAAALILLRPA